MALTLEEEKILKTLLAKMNGKDKPHHRVNDPKTGILIQGFRPNTKWGLSILWCELQYIRDHLEDMLNMMPK